MTARGWILWFFPPPRRRVTLRAALPLILFITLFLGGAGIASAANWVLFVTPSAFLLTLVMPWVWWLHMGGYGGLTGGRALAAFLVRLILVAIFIILFAGPRSVRTNDNLSIVFAVDKSASINSPAYHAAITYVMNGATKGKPEKDQAGLIEFGRDAAVELQPSTSFPYEGDTVEIDRDGTNIEKGLSLSAAMLPQDTQGRVVLITDGVENEGNTRSILDDLKSRGIPVDVLPVVYDYGHEVWLERIELPRFTKVGETYEAVVILSSLQPGEGELTLRENDNVIFQKKVTYSAGKNRYALPIRLRTPGYYEYTATIGPPDGVPRQDWPDGTDRNNIAISYLYLKGQGRVLVVVDPAGEPRDYQDLVRGLNQAKQIVDVRPAFEFPSDPMALLPYDCVIFTNVGADLFAANQLAALHDAVYDQGTGFLMVGGQNSFGPGGYRHTPVEEILPVSMDVSQKKVLPKGALVIIIHTCEIPDGSGNVWAKEITKRAIRVLSPQDEAGALDYDLNGGNSWIFPLTPVSDYPRLVARINAAVPGDMPSFATLMSMALAGLKGSDASAKHLIIISDGDPSPPTPELLDEFVANKITVSTVAIFPHDGRTQESLENIAYATNGRFYFPHDPNLLPSIFIKEAKTLQRTMIQNRIFHPQLDDPSEILKGIPLLPDLGGYVLTSAKPRSTTILRSPETQEVEPILSTWRFGTGKTAAFTSDLSPNWGANWVKWDKYVAFLKQLMTDISRVNALGNLRIQTYPANNQGVVIVEDYSDDPSFLDIKAQVKGPHDLQPTISLKQVAPRRYEGKFDLSGEGRYQITAVGVGAGRTERVNGGFVVPYSQEYLRFRSDPILLNEIAQKTGGRLLTGTETGKELFDIPREERRSSQPIFDWFLILLTCLVPLDVGLRRVQIDMSVIRGWLGARPAGQASQGTFKVLQQRKQSIQTAFKRKDKPATPTITRDDELLKNIKPQAPGKPAAGTPPATDTPENTTSRLLAMKKKRKDEGPK